MGAMTPEELLRHWSGEALSADMAIGQVLQHLVKLQTTVESLNRTVSKLRADTEALGLRTSATPAKSSKRRSD